MPRVQKVIAQGAVKGGPAGKPPVDSIADTLLLKFDDRCRQQGFVFGGKGTCIEFDFPEPPCLRTDDLLVLEDGRFAEVVADIEPVLEMRTGDFVRNFAAVARFILAAGNRHLPVQIMANRLRLQKRPEVEALIAEHGLTAAEMAVPFEPDDGGPHEHAHAHGAAAGHHCHHHHGDEHGHGHRHHDDHGHGGHHHPHREK